MYGTWVPRDPFPSSGPPLLAGLPSPSSGPPSPSWGPSPSSGPSPFHGSSRGPCRLLGFVGDKPETLPRWGCVEAVSSVSTVPGSTSGELEAAGAPWGPCGRFVPVTAQAVPACSGFHPLALASQLGLPGPGLRAVPTGTPASRAQAGVMARSAAQRPVPGPERDLCPQAPSQCWA